VKGTHAHAFVSSFSPDSTLPTTMLAHKETGEKRDLLALSQEAVKTLGFKSTNKGELIAFVAFTMAHPDNLLALVDTYNTLDSGVPNFLSVATALHQLGYKALGVRLDSGDLAYLSRQTRKMFNAAAKTLGENYQYFVKFNIVASNDLNESTILSLNQQGHEINTYGVGTNLVTCQAQPALGAVYKLVQIDNHPRIKLSETLEKISLPGRKEAFRLFDKTGCPIFDVLALAGGEAPQVGQKILCRHPFDEAKRAYVVPTKVKALHQLVWDQGNITVKFPSMDEIREYSLGQIRSLREDHIRSLNPTPYKVSVTNELYDFIHKLWLQEAPIHEFS